jgi:predicted O-methyltransferase YrrM
MKLISHLKRMIVNSDKSVELLGRTAAGLANQSNLLNDKFREVTIGVDNQSRLLNERLRQLVEGMSNQSHLLNEKLEQIYDGGVSQSRLLNDKLMAIIERQNALMELQKAEIAELRKVMNGRGGLQGADLSTIQVAPVAQAAAEPPRRPKIEIPKPDTTSDLAPRQPAADATAAAGEGKSPQEQKVSFETAMSRLPLMIASKTYNTSHPDYDANLVRNYPGKIFNADKPCSNVVYAALKKFAQNGEVADAKWASLLSEALEEAKTVPHSGQVFERRAYIENYMREIAAKYAAHYAAGWVNLDDALFLYWLVRKLKPRTIVQTGVCNGLSSAFMMLGLVKNGPEGRLHVIDLPPVFDSKDPGWTVKGKVYGVCIPEGKSSGWIVPDAYRDRFEIMTGDAKALLPKLVDKVDSIDLFYHDSDHTYDHMMFEFDQAKRKLRPGGLIVGDDISWNASVWDFADRFGVPSYNFKGAVGVAFF